ncbi:UDP-glucose 4-epimerase GalE [Zymomonas mobilis]|uniref:UDP-glucose 4-epimerase n=1 Tax=Zymomonas mobilis subsp. mobilis (strain ATCC 10988 / DSM 424 / LMG 404 / NCIMB 8938 / NRRL B-806 / ZM1) TaxID=555217 RepID=A0A0H3G0T5_ZYMMA|nr:UDP-glucose 4-epimerase GalE [Zymomonas mobilis]AEH62387.1 UDP-glucose 4-epimerase [Zymomonas mobilis subsp. mobilis ATCC 10988]ART93029.1 UDP-glucose 4-epimerase GalE [Zymomonas mobilis subsp. mobilis]TQL28018.1 UDP-glucose 4-epimerase [Zymomonas mobilis]TQL29953.1 UDP-glucose 4-epimerase [Zymomonas mobilis]TWD59700.1 UDP-glucose 4-epimerase [Zymomonas mobilis]
MRYLVTGGAGFVGSHTVLALLDAGHEVVVLDNLSTGHIQAVPKSVEFHHVDLLDKTAIANVIANRAWDGVFHFAALSQVAESMRKPLKYFYHNYLTAFNLIQTCIENNINKLVFSSTAALFGGENRVDPISETDLIQPGSPYGESKYMIERILYWADRIYHLHSACLRYFNAAGADHLGRAGEDHRPETHLIPLTIDSALGRRPTLKLFGTDYPTRDGSCIRDYVHVSDLANAHLRAIDQINDRSVVYNVGNGQGYSNLEVIESVERVSGQKVSWEPAPRRQGDPAVLVADSTALQKDTGWMTNFGSIDKIVETALLWREKHPQGYI